MDQRSFHHRPEYTSEFPVAEPDALTPRQRLSSTITHIEPSGPACNLSPDELRERRQELIPGLLKHADELCELPNGLRLQFAARTGLLAELAHIIENEQTYCSFLRFRIDIEPSGGPIIFEVTGPAGTREMLRSL